MTVRRDAHASLLSFVAADSTVDKNRQQEYNRSEKAILYIAILGKGCSL